MSVKNTNYLLTKNLKYDIVISVTITIIEFKKNQIIKEKTL